MSEIVVFLSTTSTHIVEAIQFSLYKRTNEMVIMCFMVEYGLIVIPFG